MILRSPAAAFAVLLTLATLPAGPALAGPRDILFFAPGAPGDEEQAKPTLEAFAAELTRRMPPGEPYRAFYRNDGEEGARFLREKSPGLVFLTLEAFLRHGTAGKLTPLLEVMAEGTPQEEFSVFAPSAVAGGKSLSGVPLAGAPCWDPRFVGRIVLGSAEPPASCDALAPALRSLKAAIAGERIAVILDAAQAKSLKSLPGGDSLKKVSGSGPVPAGFLATPGTASAETAKFVEVLRKMAKEKAGSDALRSIRMAGVRDLDAARLEALRKKYEGR